MMRRGDIVGIALQGDAGKLRPALVIQSDLLANTRTLLVIPFTSTLVEADYAASGMPRFTVAPDAENGLQSVSQLMFERLSATRRDRCRGPFGRLSAATMEVVSLHLALVVGLADPPPSLTPPA